MALKWNSTIICCAVLLSSMISCTQSKESRTEPSEEKENDFPVATDSLVFKTSSETFIYLSQRLHPSSNYDSSSQNSIRPDVLSIEKVGDTVLYS
jgi:hypothetical protein